jgi:hypothetical protein
VAGARVKVSSAGVCTFLPTPLTGADPVDRSAGQGWPEATPAGGLALTRAPAADTRSGAGVPFV